MSRWEIKAIGEVCEVNPDCHVTIVSVTNN